MQQIGLIKCIQICLGGGGGCIYLFWFPDNVYLRIELHGNMQYDKVSVQTFWAFWLVECRELIINKAQIERYKSFTKNIAINCATDVNCELS
jgi:hypothetical protein